MALTPEKALLADQLFELGAVQLSEEGFKLKLHETQPDAPRSPIYLNLRTARHPVNPGPLTDEVMQLVGDLFAGKLLDLPFSRFVDLPDAGEPFGDQVERILWEEQIRATRLWLNKVRLSDGQRRIAAGVRGYHKPGMTCLVVDELITQAGSKFEAIKALEAAGLVVHDVLVLVDRCQGGREQLATAGYRVHSVITLLELLQYYFETGRITANLHDRVRSYLAINRV